MLKLLRMLISLGCLGMLAWFGATVPLGGRTLFGHISAIGQSKESQELVRGTKEKVEDLRKRIGTGEGATKGDTKSEGKGEGHAVGKNDSKSDGKAAGTAEGAAAAAGKDGHTPAGPPQDRLTKVDRKEMRRLIETARAKAPKGTSELR